MESLNSHSLCLIQLKFVKKPPPLPSVFAPFVKFIPPLSAFPMLVLYSRSKRFHFVIKCKSSFKKAFFCGVIIRFK